MRRDQLVRRLGHEVAHIILCKIQPNPRAASASAIPPPRQAASDCEVIARRREADRSNGRRAAGRRRMEPAHARACRRRDGREARRACRRWTQEGTHGVPPTHPRTHALRYSCPADRTCRKWRNSRFRLVCSSAGRSSTSISLSRYLRARALPTIAPAQPPSERCSSGCTAGGCGLGPAVAHHCGGAICGLALPCVS